MDPDFSEALKLANKNGVKILAYDSLISENSIILDKEVPIFLE